MMNATRLRTPSGLIRLPLTARELAVLVYAKERAHSKVDKVIGRMGHRVFAFAQRGMSRNKAA